MSFFSKLGKDMILPPDVLIQSKETNSVDGAINATIGMATENGKVMKIKEIESIIKNLNFFEYLPYSPTTGTDNIRKLWKEKIIKENKNINPDYLSTPIATTGITQAIDTVANLFSQKGDALLLPDLFWANYLQIFTIKLKNNIYKYNQFEDNKYDLKNIEFILNNIKEDKITILLNFPNNPTGYTPSTEEFEKLTNIIKQFANKNKNKKIIIICDDAYFGLFFEENHNNSTLNSMHTLVDCENCLIAKLDGITKEFYSWGLRLGFVTFYTKNLNLKIEIENKVQGFLRSSTSSNSTLAQKITEKILTNDKAIDEKNNNDKIILERYKLLKKIINKEKLNTLVKILPFNSGYFFTIKLPNKINAEDFRKKLLYEYHFGVYAMDESHIRIAFSCLDNENIINIIKSIKKCLLNY